MTEYLTTLWQSRDFVILWGMIGYGFAFIGLSAAYWSRYGGATKSKARRYYKQVKTTARKLRRR